MARRNTSKKLPSDNDITSKLAEFDALIDKVIAGEANLKARKETATTKLDLIKDALIKFKSESNKPKVPYSTIAQVIKEHFDLTISDQTLRKYCQSQLGFQKGTNKTSNVESTESTKTPETTEMPESIEITEKTELSEVSEPVDTAELPEIDELDTTTELPEFELPAETAESPDVDALSAQVENDAKELLENDELSDDDELSARVDSDVKALMESADTDAMTSIENELMSEEVSDTEEIDDDDDNLDLL